MPASPQSRKRRKPASPPQPDLAFRPRSYRWPRRARHAAASTLNEVVIARIALATPHAQVVTLRARRDDDGRIRYRMIHADAHGPANRRIRIKPASSDRPLTFGELVELIDAAYYDGACADAYDQECYGRVLWGTLRLQFEHGRHHADAYLCFATVTSEHYPELEAYYAQRLADWCLDHCEEEEDCGKIVKLKLRR